jgi:guanylate kinase
VTVVALAGPAGVGKGTVVRRLIEQHPQFMLSVSATTRDPRPDEIDGVHYHFVTEAEFDRLIAQDELLEWAEVHRQHRYGTPMSELGRAESAGKVLLLEIDLQGVRQVRERVSGLVSIFLLPPSQHDLEQRLRLRGTESEDEIARRLETARVELNATAEFDHLVINNEVDECVREIVDLVFPMKENHDRKA